MEFSIKNVNLEKDLSDCLVVGVYEEAQLSACAQALDEASGGFISQIIKHGDMEGKLASTLILHHVLGIKSPRVLLVGLGKSEEFNSTKFSKVARATVKALSTIGVKEVLTTLISLPVKNETCRRKAALLAEAMLDASYQFNAMKQKKSEDKKEKSKKELKKVVIYALENEITEAKSGLAEGEALAKGVSLAKDLGNLPPNICTPSYLAEQAQKMGKHYDFKVKVLDTDELKKLGMGSFLGVAQGSIEPPKFIIMQH